MPRTLHLDSRDLARRFRALYTGALTDVLDELGYRHQTLPPAIVPLEVGMKVAGWAFAVEGRSHPHMPRDESIRKILEMLAAIPPDHVGVYQAGDESAAHFGELSATSLQTRGCAGVVIDGGCRDVDFIRRARFPVFARYRTPQDAVGRWEVLRWGHEVTIGEVRIATGDYVVGDGDGAVVIPASGVEGVLTRAEAVASTENSVRDAVRAGLGPLEAYESYGKF